MKNINERKYNFLIKSDNYNNFISQKYSQHIVPYNPRKYFVGGIFVLKMLNSTYSKSNICFVIEKIKISKLKDITEYELIMSVNEDTERARRKLVNMYVFDKVDYSDCQYFIILLKKIKCGGIL